MRMSRMASAGRCLRASRIASSPLSVSMTSNSACRRPATTVASTSRSSSTTRICGFASVIWSNCKEARRSADILADCRRQQLEPSDHDAAMLFDCELGAAPRQQRLDEPEPRDTRRDARQVEARAQLPWVLDAQFHALGPSPDAHRDTLLAAAPILDRVRAQFVYDERKRNGFVLRQPPAP